MQRYLVQVSHNGTVLPTVRIGIYAVTGSFNACSLPDCVRGGISSVSVRPQDLSRGINAGDKVTRRCMTKVAVVVLLSPGGY